MTESEWLSIANHSQWMIIQLRQLGVARNKAGRRKLRLFSCGCCQVIWNVLPDNRLRDAVQTAERFADDLATKDELSAARAAVEWMRVDSGQFGNVPLGVRVAIDMAVATTDPRAFAAAFAMTACLVPLAGQIQPTTAETYLSHLKPATTAETYLCQLVRCVFGNPFRTVSAESNWLKWGHGTVPKLARSIYEERRFSDLPVLADALEEAGCTHEDILGHLRGPGPHIRGCWPVDLLLAPGK